MAAATARLQAALRTITVRVATNPAPRRIDWYYHALRWRLHTADVSALIATYICFGFPRDGWPWSACLARVCLSSLWLVIHAATS